MSRSARAFVLLSVLAILGIAAAVPSVLRVSANVSDAWGVSGWSYRKEITISHTNVDSDLTDFPLLVKISGDTDIGAHARSDGYDLRFTLADGTSLPYEREDFSISGGAATGDFWVKVPTISATADTTIYAYYGKSDATDGQSATSVWDSNFKGVWHAKEATGVNWADSTSNGNTGTNNGVTATTSGQVDGGGSFNGSTSNIGISNGSIPEKWRS
jgi:MSHA biogenesis protein MshQ